MKFKIGFLARILLAIVIIWTIIAIIGITYKPIQQRPKEFLKSR